MARPVCLPPFQVASPHITARFDVAYSETDLTQSKVGASSILYTLLDEPSCRKSATAMGSYLTRHCNTNIFGGNKNLTVVCYH